MDGTPIIVKKKKHEGHAHHGGSWKVAYADFVTAMMAFFMVMWIMGLSDETRTQISGYFNDPMGYSKTAPLSQNIVPQNHMEAPKASTKQLESEGKAEERKEIEGIESKLTGAISGDAALRELMKHIEMKITEDGLIIEFVEDAGAIFFDSGRATIKPKALKLIMTVAPFLAASGRPLQIRGHTDSVPYGAAGYDNMDLSMDRARSLRKTLQAGGVQFKQIIECTGYADHKLRYPNDPKNPRNRRVSVMLPFGPRTPAGDAQPDDVDVKGSIGPKELDLIGDLGNKEMPKRNW